MDIQAVHNVLIILHATTATLSFFAGCFLILSLRNTQEQGWFGLYWWTLVGMVVFLFVGGTVVRLLWNWLLPPLFEWPQITFWQALGLLALCRILFGGLGRGGGYGDLEYALLRAEGKIREYTPILTTVHPLQLIDDRLPMRGHDIPVDFVVTPDQVIAAPSLHPRPRGVIWEILRRPFLLAYPGCGASACMRSIAERLVRGAARMPASERPSFVRRLFSAITGR